MAYSLRLVRSSALLQAGHQRVRDVLPLPRAWPCLAWLVVAGGRGPGGLGLRAAGPLACVLAAIPGRAPIPP
jgi:hypothetical protein